MLKTLPGLWLLLMLGVITGACLGIYNSRSKGERWKVYLLVPGLAAGLGAIWLIAEWTG